MRLSTYWKKQGATVQLKHGAAYPELWGLPDKVFISCLFRWNRDAALQLAYAWDDRAEIGGTGINFEVALPPEVEACPPDYSLYGEQRAIGFISRGCSNKCPWCVVWRKEGNVHRVSTAQELATGHNELLALDNNFLALPGHQDDLKWLVQSQMPTDFNQGLDARMVTEENAALLAKVNWKSSIRFALDSGDYGSKQWNALENTVKLLSHFGLSPSHVLVYVLIGFWDMYDDVNRLLEVHNLGARPFPMGFRDLETGYEPASGWNRVLYQKFKRLICRVPYGHSVWDDFEREVVSTL